ncbi:MAG: sensor histidine kinase [Bacteroidetes bacterium]|nr:sensor histidine kinase [Bacteroidota bacterium]
MIKSISLTCFIVLFFILNVRSQEMDSILKIVNPIMTGNPALSPSRTGYVKDTARISVFLIKAREYQSSHYDSLKYYSFKALDASLRLKDLLWISRSMQMTGRYYGTLEDYKNQGVCYLTCLKIEEQRKDLRRIAELTDELGVVYSYQEIFNKSLQYYTKALDTYLQLNDTLNIAKCYSHIGTLHSSREFCETRTLAQRAVDFATAIKYLEKSVDLCRKINYKPLMINGFVNIGSVYNKLDQPSKALPYILDALSYYRQNNNLNNINGTLYTLGKTYFKLKKYDLSTNCYLESMKIGLDNHFLDGIQYLYEAMAQTYASANDFKNAYKYYLKYMTIRDSLVNAEKARSLFELETKYQSEKKEKEILKLTSEKREKNFLILTLTCLVFLMTIIGFFIFKNIRNNRIITEQTIRIKEQHIQELEKERQLIATRSVLQGEEAERSRMARDLHDGLGGLLSGVKINLSAMKGNSIITEENAQAFDHAIKLLDHSITELRRVAHNMMPETLVHYGLKAAFEDFISRMRTEDLPGIDFQFFGEEGRYSSELEITVYRIGQELVNNALKHSEAQSINLQLISESSRLCIQVMDNGKGFDTSLKSSGGKGLESIRDRVAANNGKFEIWSKPSEGTEATVEFLLS